MTVFLHGLIIFLLLFFACFIIFLLLFFGQFHETIPIEM
jgi:hypothetical protein